MSEKNIKDVISVEEGTINWKPALYVGGGVVVVWCFTLLSFVYGPELTTFLGLKYPVFVVGERGTFGDMFGGVNSLFSGLAFTGIIFTILLQRKEFELQREELKATRKVMNDQGNTLNTQRFENTFFAMLSLHNEMLATMDIIYSNGNTKKGKACLKNHMDALKNKWPKFANDPSDEADKIAKCYQLWYSEKYTDVAHYFRMLYTIVKFVDDSNMVNKKQYTNIVRAQLSAQEQMLLFYNGLSKYGNEKFKPLTVKYELLENMPVDILLDKAHRDFYSIAAYGDSWDNTVNSL